MKNFAADSLIPLEFWGKHHWSTLAYVDSVMTDCAGFEVGADARMKSNRRNFRVMLELNPLPKRAGRRLVGGCVMRPQHTSVLKEATSQNHDDWCCIQDMAAEGLFRLIREDHVEPGAILCWSDRGQVLANALRAHKQAAGSFADFNPKVSV